MKKASDSRTEQIQIALAGDINGAGRLFGGRMMEWIDVTAAVVARRHSGCDVTTASVDTLQFKAPAFVNDTVCLMGEIVYTGNTSMVVRVDSYVESLSGSKTPINRAYLTLVALDENGKPTRVPALLIETPEQQREWDAVLARRQQQNKKEVDKQ